MKRVDWKRLLAAGVTGCVLTAGAVARADESNAILDLLEKKGIITADEADMARKYYTKQQAEAVVKFDKTKLGSWIDELKWNNDLRLRTEYFDNEDQSSTVDRLRFRYRLRLGFEAKFTDWATAGFRLASGSASDPVSTNETMDDMFQKDPIQIDLAYITVRPMNAEWIAITGGKMNNPMWQPGFASPLLYDYDVTPEGVAEQLTWKLGRDQRHTLFVNASQFVINEIANSSDTDGYLFDTQGGVDMKFGKDIKNPVVRAKLAGGFFWTDNAAVTNAIPNNSPTRGNSVKPNGSYLADFAVIHAEGEVAWQLRDAPVLGTPAVLTVSGGYVKNIQEAFETLSGATTNIAPDQTQGWSVQAQFGSAKKKGEWQVAYQYKYLEADAVMDAVADSDWGTVGGTDRKGHVVKAAYNIQEWWQLGITAFITEKISNRPNSGARYTAAPRTGEDLLRVQIDNVFKF